MSATLHQYTHRQADKLGLALALSQRSSDASDLAPGVRITCKVTGECQTFTNVSDNFRQFQTLNMHWPNNVQIVSDMFRTFQTS